MTSSVPEGGMLDFRCPHDNSLILRYSSDFVGIVEGKCKKCKKIFSVKIVGEKKTKQ